jgi:hypothetical protein
MNANAIWAGLFVIVVALLVKPVGAYLVPDTFAVRGLHLPPLAPTTEDCFRPRGRGAVSHEKQLREV